MNIEKNNRGTYILILILNKNKKIRIGKLGIINFNAGFYGYVGSAFGRGGLKSRLNHHLKITQSPLWHIDYFRRYSKIKKIWYKNSQQRLEHVWAELLSSMPEVDHQIELFGSSDCSCLSHFFYFKKMPSISRFRKLVHRNVNCEISEIDLTKRKQKIINF